MNDLKQEIIALETRHEERHAQQLIFNEKLTDSVSKMAETVNKLEVFQAELNHTNDDVSDLRKAMKENSDDIDDIRLTQVSNQTIIDELKRWRLWILGAIGGLIVTYIGSQFMAPKPDPVQQSLLEVLKELKKG